MELMGAKRGIVRGAEQLSLRGVTSKVRLSLRALQAAPKLVGVVKLEKEGAVGQTRAVMGRPSEAYCESVTELGQL
eukprot:2045472-Pleurochrysis_carterae.AAC.3